MLAPLFLLAAGPRAPQPPEPLAQILQRYQAATERPGATPIVSLEVRGTLAGSGLSGTFHSWRDGARERNDSTLGPSGERFLIDGDRVAVQDENGDVRELRGVLARRERTQRFVDDDEFLDHPETVRFAGTTQRNGRIAYALEIAAPGGEPETLVVDAQSGLPLEESYIEGDGPVVVTIGDWRLSSGHLFAWRATFSDGEHAFDEVETTQEVRVNETLDPQLFAPFVPRVVNLAAPVTVPIESDGYHLYCRVAIGSDSYRFIIDSGASGIVLDSRVARAQGIVEEGALEVRGTSRSGGLHLVRIPSLRVGELTLNGLTASSLDLGDASGGVLRADGILGYPFFAAGLVRIDPIGMTMTMARPDGFTPRGTRLDVELDRKLPEVRLAVNGRTAPFMLDTGNSSELLLFRWFVERYPGLVPSAGQTVMSYGIGSGAQTYQTIVDQLEVAGNRLYQRHAEVVLARQGAFADRFEAGNVGLGVLRNFVITFDDPHYGVYLERSRAFDDGRARALDAGNTTAIGTPSRRP